MPRIWLTVCGLAPCFVRYTTRLSTTGGTRPATWCWCLTSRTPSSTRMFLLRYGAKSYATPKIKMSNGIFLCPQDEIFSAIWTDAKLFKEKSFWCLTFFLIKCNLKWRLKTARRFTCSNKFLKMLVDPLKYWGYTCSSWNCCHVSIICMRNNAFWSFFFSFFFLYVLITDILHIHVYFTDSLQQDNGAIRFVCIQKRKY